MRAQRLKKIQVGDTGSIRTPIATRTIADTSAARLAGLLGGGLALVRWLDSEATLGGALR
jgi:hypothetical protein